MRIHYDDDERALLAARLGHPESVSDADLAASVAAWIDGKPLTPANGKKLTASDLERIRAVTDWNDVADEHGYAADPTWLGAG